MGELSARVDVRLLQTRALGVRSLLFPAVALVGTAGLLALATAGGAFAVFGATWAVIAVTGTAVVTRLAPASTRGGMLGVHAALVAAAGGIGGLLGGWAAQFGYWVAFGLAGGLVALGAAVVATLRGLSALDDLDATGTERESTSD